MATLVPIEEAAPAVTLVPLDDGPRVPVTDGFGNELPGDGSVGSLPDSRGVVARTMEGAQESFGERPLGISEKTRADYPALDAVQPLAVPLDAALRSIAAAVGGGAGAVAGLAEKAGLSRTDADRLQRDLNLMAQVAAVEVPVAGPAALSRSAARSGKVANVADDAGRTAAREAIEPAPAPLAPEIPPQPVAPSIVGSDRAGNINLNRIYAPEDVKEAIRQTARENRDFGDARRGVVTQEQTREMATLLGMSADDLAKRKIGQAYNAEEMFAARELLVKQAERVKELAPIARTGNDIEKATFAAEVTRLAAIQEQVAGATAEAGRALAQFRMMAGATRDEIANIVAMSKATGLDDLAAKIAGLDDIGQVTKFAASAFKAKTSDMLLEGWINALLSGPTTHATNILSNSLVSLYSIPERALAAGISKATGSGIAGREALGRVFGIVEGAKEGIPAAWRAFRTEQPSDAATKLDVRKFQAIPSVNVGGVEIGGKQIRIPGRLLQAEDEFFKAIGYRQEINSLAYRQAIGEGLKGQKLAERVADLRANPTEAMTTAARDAAAKQTFSNPLGTAGQALTTMTREIPALRIVMPFIRTPLNVVKFAAERSPFAPLMKEVRENLKGANGPAARDMQIARIGMGSAISAVVASMAGEGSITGGGPANSEKKSLMRTAGWQPYSVKIGDTYYSYSRLEPLGMLMGVAADFAELSKAMKEDEEANLAALIMGSVSKNLVSKTWLQGPSDLIEAVNDPDRYGPRYIQRLVGTVIPTGIAQVARANDPYLREARNILDTIRSRIPGEREQLFIRRDAFGEPIRTEGAAGPDLLSPIYQSAARNDPAIKEMLRLDVIPGRLQRQIRGVELEPAEYDAFSRHAGQLFKQSIDHLVGHPEWSSIPDDAKTELMNATLRKARDLARSKTMSEFPDLALRAAEEKQSAKTYGKDAR
jgi:hypothetical protein